MADQVKRVKIGQEIAWRTMFGECRAGIVARANRREYVAVRASNGICYVTRADVL